MMDNLVLVIKSANQKYEDFKIDSCSLWTVLDLKIHLHQNHPSNPRVSDQRLIYSGHLLSDGQTIKDIVEISEPSSNVFTFHLVCPQKTFLNKNNEQNQQSQCSSSSSSTAKPATTSLSAANQDGPFPGLSSGSAATTIPPSFGGNVFGPPIDNIVIQNAYQTLMNQYYHYMSYYLLSSPPLDMASYSAFAQAYQQSLAAFPATSISANLSSSSSTINAINNNINHDNNNYQNQINRNFNRAQQQQQQANNNENNDLLNFDWTDWLYSIPKAMVMFSIIYFYSSFNRLILMLSIFFVFYLYKNVFNGLYLNLPNNNNNNNPGVLNRNINNNNNNNNRAGEQQRPQQAENDNGNIVDDDDELARLHENNNNNNEQPEIGRYSFLRLFWMFISSLFTSLIPDPVPVN